MKKLVLLPVILAALVSLGLSACGGGDDAAAQATATPTTVATPEPA